MGPRGRVTRVVARGGLAVGRAAAGLASRLVPRRVVRALDDRLFGAIFQTTRVTNDDYGWRPDPADPAGPVSPDPVSPAQDNG